MTKVSRECLGLICLVTDTFIPLTVHGIINLSFVCFHLHPYSTAGKTVVCSTITFVLVETSKTFMIFVKFAIAYSFLGLFNGVAVIGDEKHQTLQLVTVLISSRSEKMFTFSTVLITLLFCRFKLRHPGLLLFLTHFINSILSYLLSTITAISSACVMVLIFHVTFPIPVTVSPTPPVTLYVMGPSSSAIVKTAIWLITCFSEVVLK